MMQQIVGRSNSAAAAVSADPPPIKVSAKVKDQDLFEYAAQFGLKLERLDDNQIAMLMAAKNLEPYVASLKIPFSERRIESGEMITVEREVEKRVPKTTYTSKEVSADTPADRMDLSTVRGPSDLPNLTPAEWVLEDVAPDLFLKRLAERELLKRDWKEATQEPKTHYETIKVRERKEEPAPPKIEKHHAYVLIDISGSMNETDGRCIVARGMALAFIRQAFAERSKIMLRYFDGDPRAKIEVNSELDFQLLAGSLLSQRNLGGTDIGAALSAAVNDIYTNINESGADILLISDGVSYLAGNPLGKIRLHSQIIGVLDSYEKNLVQRLEKISKTFRHFDPSEFKELWQPKESDFEKLNAFLKSIPTRVKQVTSREKLDELIKDFYKTLKLVDTLTRLGWDQESNEISEIKKKFTSVKQKIEQADWDKIIAQNLAREKAAADAAAAEIERQKASAAAKLDAALNDLRKRMNGSDDSSQDSNSNEKISLFEYLLRKAESAWLKVRDYFKSFRGRN